ncbi:hypothetical protein J1N35_031210 [Gossypium stocksii]|uniref:Uncharacterized protein n=1 Tax=Gossypium stocksii TaxID=47602 RepID=A0A9D3V1D8_9ROSI|nr:hypothetical protein J1N35_031210 [Gossypium stocksii]
MDKKEEKYNNQKLVDLCHEADDEEEEDDQQGFIEALLQNSINRPRSSIADSRICYPFRLIHVGNRQKIVILVNHEVMTVYLIQVYVDLFAAAQLLLGGALAYYGLLLCQKMRNVRSERASSEIWKVAGLATLSVLCFTSSSFVALFTNIPICFITGMYRTYMSASSNSTWITDIV